MDPQHHDRRAVVLTRIRYTAIALFFLAALALLPFRPLKVSGHSMEPTLRSGETYVLDQFYWRGSGLRRMDIVVVRHGEEKWVKRLVGVPGDRLLIATFPDGWIAWIANLKTNPKPPPRPRGTLTMERDVQPDEIFVVGDNLNRSLDSTNQEAGAFKLEDVVGVVRTPAMSREFPIQKHL